MHRFLIVIFILILLLSCEVFAIPLTLSATTITPTIQPATSTPIPPSPAPTLTSIATSTPLAASPTITVSQTVTAPGEAFTVYYHPDDKLYVGDQVSFEVISPPGLELKDSNVQVQVDPPAGPTLKSASFAAWGIQGREEATLLWAWDTKDQAVGEHSLAFSIQPQGYIWNEQVTLLPASDMPPNQVAARWESTQTQCCTIYYITNTASQRDLPGLVGEIDEQASLSIDQMDASFTQPITVTVLPRLLGHGGFTSTEISVSYLDRNYAADSWAMVLHHEMIHVIDAYLGGDFRPTLFVEGLAVYMTGGHYKPEPLMPRAATLLEGYLYWYIPLKTLSDDFYASQHEIGYLEAASLIEYMVKTFGWEAFSAFYRDIHIKEGERQSDAINAALEAHFSISLDKLEHDFLAALSNQPDTSSFVDDVRLTVTYYDTMRRYQQLLDPSAYFRTAWLMDNKTMRDRGIVADYLRHPATPENLALETLLLTASREIADQKLTDATQTLQVINTVLEAAENANAIPFSVSSLAGDYLSISSALLEQGYEVQKIDVQGDKAQVNVTNSSGLGILTINLLRSGEEWLISP